MDSENTFISTAVITIGALSLCLAYLNWRAWSLDPGIAVPVSSVSLAVMTGVSIWLLLQAAETTK